MQIEQFVEEKPVGIWHFNMKAGGYVNASVMWEYYRPGDSYINVYVSGGTVPNPYTHKTPTNSIRSAYNEISISLDDIASVEKF